MQGSDVDENNNDPELARLSNNALNRNRDEHVTKSNKSMSSSGYKSVTNTSANESTEKKNGKNPVDKSDSDKRNKAGGGAKGAGGATRNRKSPKRRQYNEVMSQLRMHNENNDTDRENAQKRMLLTKRQ